MQGLGTELGLLNMVLYAVTASFVAMFAKRIKFLLTTDWEKVHRRHERMWTHYVRNSDDTGNFKDLL